MFLLSSGNAISVLSVLVLCFFATWRGTVAAAVAQDEVEALEQIANAMGSVYWKFDAVSCKVEMAGLTAAGPPKDSEANVTCDCNFPDATCHVVSIELKRLSLPGRLPPELVKLPYLRRIDLAYNYLNGSIPVEWASTKLEFISLVVNRLAGEIPKELGNLSSLTYLGIEANQFSGEVPRELGKLVNLQNLLLASNQFSGELPVELGELRNLTDFRVSDNDFSGAIPDFIQNWKQLERLEMIASGLDGPIPSSISGLTSLTDIRISDLSGESRDFPPLENMTGLTRLYLRNCNISGKIPSYIWRLNNLIILDLSFNKLVGEIPTVINSQSWKFIFLTGNLLSGNIPESILRKGTNVDLSYNNFTWQSPEQPACRQSSGLNLNLYRCSSSDSHLRDLLPCIEDLSCRQYGYGLYVNSGGDEEKIKRDLGNTAYQGDGGVSGGAARFFLSDTTNWGLSSTGDFMDDNDFQNTVYIQTFQSSNISKLYTTARLSPLSLTYFRYCMQNGSYAVDIHFAEIQFKNDNTYSSLGRRIFDIYIQDKLVQKNFNIENEAKGTARPTIKQFNATVTNGILEIRFHWAGKGTTRVPTRGAYGPLVSAISVDPNFTPRTVDNQKSIAPIIIGILGSSLFVLALGLLIWKIHFKSKAGKEKDLKGLDLQTGSFSLRHILAATNNFDPVNKIGEGGFGPVYKGHLYDGTVIAVKQLSSKSNQGNREFLNEMGMISCLQHPNLVKLYGCCVEGDQLLLVYEYLENNSLSRALLGPEKCQLKLDWPTRYNICIGIAKGLVFLHEESRLKIIHRDIKGTNVLLDNDLNPKISDFGLAKLHEEEKTHVSTRIAGTIGYMAPEYALWGYLTYKADVYSFGIVALEVVSGKHNMSYGPENEFACLLDWACHLQQSGKLIELVDQRLGSDYNKAEAERTIRVALLCTNASPSLRPTMSEAVSMLEGAAKIPDAVPEASTYSEDLRFKAIRDHHKQIRSQTGNPSRARYPTAVESWAGSVSVSTDPDLYDIDMESYLRLRTMRNRSDQENVGESHTQISTSDHSFVGSSTTTARDLY